MSTTPLNPEEMQQLQQVFQRHDQELTAELEQASALMQSGRAREAYAAFQEIQQKEDAFLNAWEPRLIQAVNQFGMDTWWREQIAQEKAGVLWSLGQAAALIGELNIARNAFEQAIALLGDQPSGMRAMLFDATANICRLHAEFDGAERFYRQACDDYRALGMWQQLGMALTSLADCTYTRGDRAGFLQHLDEAILVAQVHQLPELERDLQLKKFRFRLSTDPSGATLQAIKQEKSQLKSLSQDAGFQTDVNLLIAEFASQRSDLDSAEEAYQDALATAKDIPTKQWVIWLGLADIHESREQISKAIQSAEQALSITRILGLREPTAQALQKLIALRAALPDPAQREQAAREMDELRRLSDPQDYAMTLLTRALSFYQAKQFDLALTDLIQAEQVGPTPELQQRALGAQSAVLRETGRLDEALAVNLKSIELLDAQRGPTNDQSFTKWKDLLRDYAALHINAAVLTSKLGRPREAFHWLEESKAQVLRWQLEQASLQASTVTEISKPSFEEVRGWLASDSAALVMFCVSSRDTLMLVVDPSQSEPLSLSSPLTTNELKELFPDEPMSEEKWNDTVFKALPTLSTKLLPPLRDVIHRCKVLYLVPESRLYFVPFAALTLDDGTRLIEHCALAYAPSATILKWCRSHRVENATCTCLAVGVGKEKEYSFAEQVQSIANESGWAKADLLSEATAEQFLEQAPHYDVLHLSCHGLVERGNLDTLSSSQLQFANRMLTSKEIFDRGTQLRAQLVFLNACISGSFKSELGGEVGGFWQAFLSAGAVSLIGTLAYMHPGYAQQIALDFYREWLKGDLTKAESLRLAQLRMLQQKIDPRHWASYILIGDHR